jgi:hypothetical protein
MWNRIKSFLTSKTGIAAVASGATYLLGAIGVDVPPELAAAFAGVAGGAITAHVIKGQLEVVADKAQGPARSIEKAIKEGKLPGPKGGIGTSP